MKAATWHANGTVVWIRPGSPVGGADGSHPTREAVYLGRDARGGDTSSSGV